MKVAAIGLYRSCWSDGSGRVLGPDEDLVTLSVAAGREALANDDSGDGNAPSAVSRVVVVCADPEISAGENLSAIRTGLQLAKGVPVELRLGGAVAATDAIESAQPGALVIGVDLEGATAGAVRGSAGDSEGGVVAGLDIARLAATDSSLPMRVRHVGTHTADLYADSRVERVLGWERAAHELDDASSPSTAAGGRVLVGIPDKEAQRMGSAISQVAPTTGAAAPVWALAQMSRSDARGRLIAFEGATALAVSVRGTAVAISEDLRPSLAANLRAMANGTDSVEIPFSMPAHARAAESRMGLIAAKCVCGAYSFPRRIRCLSCGQEDQTSDIALRRTGEVYTVVTVHTPVPGVAGPYALAIVSVDGAPVRLLARVTDVVPTDCTIGERGRLVLRRVATRQGVPDYAYAFQPEIRSTKGDAS